MKGKGILTLVVMVILLAGCSGGSDAPLAPDTGGGEIELPKTAQGPSERLLWGIWGFEYDQVSGEFIAVPKRDVAAHYDITQWVMSPTCEFCFSMTVLEFKPLQKYAKIRIGLWNKTGYTGYDLRGIVVSNSEGLKLRNPDDFTKIWDDGGAIEINPFLAFAKDEPQRKFAVELQSIREYTLDFEMVSDLTSALLIIDASYPGNCKEPYMIDWFGQQDPLPDEGGQIGVWVSVFDWQDNVGPVYLDATSIGGEIIALENHIGYVWEGLLKVPGMIEPGFHNLWVIAESEGTPLIAYDQVELEVAPEECQPDENNTWEDAPLKELYTSGYGYLCPADTVDWYKFEIESWADGESYLRLTDGVDPFVVDLYADPEGESLATVLVDNEDFKILDYSSLGLGAGTYYLRFLYQGVDPGYSHYFFDLYIYDTECFPDGNDTYLDAFEISANTTSGLQMVCELDPEDWFKFELDAGPHPALEGDSFPGGGDIEITLYDELQAQDPDGPNLTSITLDNEISIDLSDLGLGAGMYYVRAKELGGGKFTLRLLEEAFVWSRWQWSASKPVSLHASLDNRIYAAGGSAGSVDLDIGLGVDIVDGIGSHDAFLISADLDGNYNWGMMWGSNYMDTARVVTSDSLGNVYVMGNFLGNIDLDPGVGEAIFSTYGTSTFLVKFDSLGNYIWGVTLGYVESGFGRGEAMYCSDSDEIYIGGSLYGSVDFDPGDGVELVESTEVDAFIWKLDSSGAFQWVVTLAGENEVTVAGITGNSSGDLYFAGKYSGDTDFDPGDGTETHIDNGGGDVYLCKYDDAGNYYWARTWGGMGVETCNDVDIDIDGNIMVAGSFSDDVDFDPGGWVEIRSLGMPQSTSDAFLNRIDPDGNFVEVGTWGGYNHTTANGVSVDELGNIYIIGETGSVCDFDPSEKVDLHYSSGFMPVYLLWLDVVNDYASTFIWGSPVYATGNDVAIDSFGDVYVLGLIMEPGDLNPGPGIEMSEGGPFISKFSFGG